jgi:GMP synthase (glutamine-hydrolysing)
MNYEERQQHIEKLKLQFKDGVREVGAALNISQNILGRHPFPGPGLAIRILSDVTEEKVSILQAVDHIFISNLKKHNLYDSVWQAGAMLLPVQSVGVMGDERTYESVVSLRAVSSVDGMTADWSHLPYEFLGLVSNEIINKAGKENKVDAKENEQAINKQLHPSIRPAGIFRQVLSSPAAFHLYTQVLFSLFF